MINTHDILETIRMIREENLDIRTVTMGISLFDCISDDPARLEARIYDKITKSAQRLVLVCEELERTYGIPIVNKRISVTPISLVGAGLDRDGFVRLARVLQRAADSLTALKRGRLGAERYLSAKRAQMLCKQLDLRGLSRAVDALKNYKFPEFCHIHLTQARQASD